MKNIFFLLLIACVNLCFSQVHKAIYEVKISEDENLKGLKLNDNGYIKIVNENAEKSLPYLLFNSDVSYFNVADDLKLEELGRVTILSSIRPIFTNIKKKLTYSIDSENKFVPIDTLKTNWNITTEAKTISNFKCFKAILNYVYVSSNSQGMQKKFNKTVTAWFCPELNYQFAPRGFGGLPGLVLEMQFHNVHYGLKSIQFNVKDKIPDTPKNYTIISKSEYEKKMFEADLKNFNER